MDDKLYNQGDGTHMWGMFNVLTNSFQFGICEATPRRAFKNLQARIGKDAYRSKFEIRIMEGNQDERTKQGNKRNTTTNG